MYLLKLTAALLAVVCPLVFAQTPPTNNAIAAAQARLNDAESAASLTAEGKALFETDSRGGSTLDSKGYQQAAYRLLGQGEFRQAIRAAATALFLSDREPTGTTAAYAKLVLATSYLAAGDLHHAQLYALAAKTQAVHQNFRADVNSWAYKLLGDSALKQGEYEKSIQLYEDSLYVAQNDLRFYSRSALAVALAKAKRADKAKEVLKAAEGYVGVIPSARQAGARASLLRVRGVVAIAEGNPDEAVKFYQGALQSIGTDESSAYDRFWMLEGLGSAAAIKGDTIGALKSYVDAIELAEKVRSQYRAEEARSGLFGEMQSVFGAAIKLMIQAGQVDAAWEINERGRSRALLDMMKNRVQFASGSSIFSEASGQTTKLADLVALLKPQQAVVSYRVLDGQTFAWVTRKSGTQAVTINLGRKELAQRVQQFRDAVVAMRTDTNALGAVLHDALLKPLAIESGEIVTFMPHDALHYLPFHALWTGDQYFLQKAEVSYAPSASALVHLMGRNQVKAGRLFAIGNPDLGDPRKALPGAQKEVEWLATRFTDLETHFGVGATRDKFFKGAPLAHTVHIAAHGTVDAIDPLYSKLYLAKETAHAGTVDARDIYALKLTGTELIVLSACETGLGKVSSGDEIWGFTRSFLSAGAPTLLVSLWPVADEATEVLMRRFYGDLEKGSSRGKALREAGLAVLADPRFSAPFFWAAFNLVGDAR